MGFLSDTLGDVGGFLFGEKPSVDRSSDPVLTKEQLALLQQLVKGIGKNKDLKKLNKETEAFEGKLAPDLSNLEKTSLAALEELAMKTVGGDSTLGAARGAVERAASSDQVNLDEFNQFFKASIQDPLIQSFKEEILPELTRRFSGNSAYGSDRITAERQASGRLTDSLARSKSDLLFQTQEAAKNRALTAAGLAPQVVGGESNLLLSLLAGGSVPREVEGAKLSADYQEFQRQQQSRQQAFNRALALLGIQPIENTAVVNPGSEGFLTKLAGGVGTGIGMAAGKAFL